MLEKIKELTETFISDEKEFKDFYGKGNILEELNKVNSIAKEVAESKGTDDDILLE